METLCSLFAGCISLTFINLLPSIAANETPAWCLPLGPRQLQLAVRALELNKRQIILSPVSSYSSSGGSAGYLQWERLGCSQFLRLLNPPRLAGGSAGLRACCGALLPAWPRPWASCAGAHGARDRTCGNSGFLGEFREVQRVINSVLPSALCVFV